MYVIRADGNAQIGAGHLMRCMTVAEEIARQSGRKDILFLCADARSAVMAEGQGFRVKVLETDYRSMEAELPKWKEIFQNNDRENVILVDSYYVTDTYLKELRAFGSVVLLDDMGAQRFPVDGIINYNASADRKVYEKLYEGSGIRLMIGSDYVPIRKQFMDKRFQIRQSVRKVLITTGGGDIDNISRKILDKIMRPDKEYYLIIGQFNPCFREMKALEEHCENVHILHNIADMASVMESCDIAVTAGGTTIYELAAIGLPFICFSYAENQESLVRYIGEKNIAGYGGEYHLNSVKTLDAIGLSFDDLCKNVKKRQWFYQQEKALIDGQGAARIAAELLK